MNQEKITLSVRELADQLGVSLPVAYELVRRSDFPSLRIGGRILIPTNRFHVWLDSQTSGCSSAASGG